MNGDLTLTLPEACEITALSVSPDKGEIRVQHRRDRRLINDYVVRMKVKNPGTVSEVKMKQHLIVQMQDILNREFGL